MVGEARGSEKQAWALASAGDDDAEVGPARKLQLFLLGHFHLDASEELDRFARAHASARNDACFVGEDGVAVCCADFEGTLGEVHVNVLAQMALEVFPFVRCSEGAQIVDDAREAHKTTMRLGGVLAYDDILLEDLAYCLLLDTPGGVKVGFELANGGPEVDLGTMVLVSGVAKHNSREEQGYSRDPPEHQ